MWTGRLELVEVLLHVGGADPHVEVFQIELGMHICIFMIQDSNKYHWVSKAGHPLVGHHDVSDVLVDKVVEAGNVLLHQSPHLGERTWLSSSLKPGELSENIYLSVLLHLEVSWNQFPFFFQIAHRLGKILLGALVPELPHLEGQTMSCKVKILLVKSYSILLCNVTKQFSHLS